MKHMDNKDLDELFKDNLNSNSANYSEDVWNKLENDLDLVKAKKGKTFSKGMIVTLMVFVSLVGLNVYMFGQWNFQKQNSDKLQSELEEIKTNELYLPIEAEQSVIDHSSLTDFQDELSESSMDGDIQLSNMASKANVEVAEIAPELSEVTGVIAVDPTKTEIEEQKENIDDQDVASIIAQPASKAAYYIKKDGKFIPVMEMEDHPGAETGDSAYNPINK